MGEERGIWRTEEKMGDVRREKTEERGRERTGRSEKERGRWRTEEYFLTPI